MTDRAICKSSDHLFVPILEVTVPLLRCVHCDVFAYQETVKQLARSGYYRSDEPRPVRGVEAETPSYWRRLWLGLRRNLGFA